MRITSVELDQIHAAIDFISNAVDGADDQDYYRQMLFQLNKVWKKGMKENARINRNKKSELK